MKISRRKLRRMIAESILKEEAVMMEEPALEKIKQIIKIEDSDTNDIFRVDTGRLHGSIGDEHSFSEANAVLNTVSDQLLIVGINVSAYSLDDIVDLFLL